MLSLIILSLVSAFLGYSASSVVSAVGQARRPVTPRQASRFVVFAALLIAGLTFVASQLQY